MGFQRNGQSMVGARCAYCALPTARKHPRLVKLSCAAACDMALTELRAGRPWQRVRWLWERALDTVSRRRRKTV